jgi:hypothetical protein
MVLASVCSSCSGAAPPAAVPQAQPAVAGILAAFEQYPVVALGEMHDVLQMGDLYVQLLRHPAFAKQVGNVVFEAGNAYYQEVIDRYINGEDVPYAEVRKAWTTTLGFGPVAMAAMYEQFYQAVREVNQQLPPEERIKVWLGDPPLEPQQPPTTRPDRDAHFAGVVLEQILKPGKKALLIIGAMHLLPAGVSIPKPGEPGGPMMVRIEPGSGGQPTLMPVPTGQPVPMESLSKELVGQILERNYPGKTFVIITHSGYKEDACNQVIAGYAASVTTPALIPVATLTALFERSDCQEWLPLPTGNPRWANAVLYLGPPETLSMSPKKAGEPPQPYLEWLKTVPQPMLVPRP